MFSGKFDGGFISQPKSMLHLPASFVWSLVNKTLSVSTHGDPAELSSYPAWSLSVCQGSLKWGVTAEKELFVTYGMQYACTLNPIQNIPCTNVEE